MKNFELWFNVGYTKLKIRYLRTKLGPLWEILGTLLIISAISFIWAKLWNKNLNEFLPYLFFGYVIWKNILSMIGDGNMVFHEVYKNVLENVYVHPFLLSMSSVTKNFIILFGFIICSILISIFNNQFHLIALFYLTLFIFFYFISSICTTFLFGLLCLRYRDLQHTIGVVLNLAFFITPVIWEPSQLGNKGQFIIDLNIIYYYIEFFRSTLINGTVDSKILIVVALMSFFLLIMTIYISKKYSRKLIFWLM